MKKLFFFLLWRYSRTEEQRLKIFKVLHYQVSEVYREQTIFGNLYNAHIEFIMSNDLVNCLVQNNEQSQLNMIENGLKNAYIDSLQHIRNDRLFNRKQRRVLRKEKLKRLWKKRKS